jgi:hypothetical protein
LAKNLRYIIFSDTQKYKVGMRGHARPRRGSSAAEATQHTLRFVFVCAILLALGSLSAATAGPVSCSCYCGKVLRPPCGDDACKAACGWQAPAYNPGAGTTPAFDPDAARRAQQEQQREAERQREEARQRDEAAKQAQFLHDRDEAAKTLKGSTGPGSLEIKGDTGSLELKSDTKAKPPKPRKPNPDNLVKPAANTAPCDRCERFKGTDVCWECCSCQYRNNLAACKNHPDYNKCLNEAATSLGNCNKKCNK